MIDLPNWLDKATWADFEEMRRKMKRPLTDAARKLAIKKLLKLWQENRDHPTDVLEQSILNGWQGLWPICQGRTDRRDEELRRELRAGSGPQTRH